MNIGTPAFRRAVSNFVPTRDMKEMRSIVQTLAAKTREIYYGKKSALEKGDASVVHQIGEGKDILSVLSEQSSSASMVVC